MTRPLLLPEPSAVSGPVTKPCPRCAVPVVYPGKGRRRLCPDCRIARAAVERAADAERKRRRWAEDPDHRATKNAANAERNRRRYQEDPEYRAASAECKRRRRARRNGTTVERFTSAEQVALWLELDTPGCVFCGAPYEEEEHLVPLSRGGGHSISNTAPACQACNRGPGGKHAQTAWEWAPSRALWDAAIASARRTAARARAA